jgi:hypothetical protein
MQNNYLIFIGIIFLFTSSPASAKGVYLTPQVFLEQSFRPLPYESKSLWLDGDDKALAKDIFQRDYLGFRVRYWQSGAKRAWILDEIGKVRPITIGVVILDNKIEKVNILEFRESRGDEVRHPFFTQQFAGLSLREGSSNLENTIDGITGATLSVRAVTRIARFALYLNHRASNTEHVALGE